MNFRHLETNFVLYFIINKNKHWICSEFRVVYVCFLSFSSDFQSNCCLILLYLILYGLISTELFFRNHATSYIVNLNCISFVRIRIRQVDIFELWRPKSKCEFDIFGSFFFFEISPENIFPAFWTHLDRSGTPWSYRLLFPAW